MNIYLIAQKELDGRNTFRFRSLMECSIASLTLAKSAIRSDFEKSKTKDPYQILCMNVRLTIEKQLDC